MYALAIASLLAGAAMAAPVAPAAPAPTAPYPTETHDVFSLVAKLTKPPADGSSLDVNNWVFSGVHTGAGETNIVLVPSGSDSSDSSGSGGGDGMTFVQNGTDSELTYASGYVERYPPVPSQGEDFIFGLTIVPSQAPNDAGEHIVALNIGPGSRGAAIRWPYTGVVYPQNQPVLGYANQTVATYTSQFYACRRDIGAEEFTALFWHSENGTTPADCAEVAFFAQCQGDATQGNATQYHTLQKTPCYADAASVPYVGYSD